MTKLACSYHVSKYMPKDIANIVISYTYDRWLKTYTNGTVVYTDDQKNITAKYTSYDVYNDIIYYSNDNRTITCTDLNLNILKEIKLNKMVLGIVCVYNWIFIETMEHIEKYDLITNSVIDKIITKAKPVLIYENQLICRYMHSIYIYSLDLKFIKSFKCSAYMSYVYIYDNMLIVNLDNDKKEVIIC